jgi:Methyltransferase domain
MARLWADAESAYRARILETLPEADPSARLLDVGCDDGGWTEEVRRRLSVPANHVHGLEIVKVRADAARARFQAASLRGLQSSIRAMHTSSKSPHDHGAGEPRRSKPSPSVAATSS